MNLVQMSFGIAKSEFEMNSSVFEIYKETKKIRVIAQVSRIGN